MDPSALGVELIESICRLPADQLPQALALIKSLEQRNPITGIEPATIAWPHAPLHRLSENGTYIVTAGTYQKEHIFRDSSRLTYLDATLLSLATKYEWHLEAWAVFSNHYHFVGHAFSDPSRLKEFLSELHATTAREMNQLDGADGRNVWHNFWDTRLTFEKSYLARLKYVHYNAVKHGLVRMANQYRWCSAAWFERTATPAQVQTIYKFKIDSLRVLDDFEPVLIR